MRKHVMKQMMAALLLLLVVPFANAQKIHVGDILCENDTIVSPSDFNSLDLAAVGVVFYIDNSGEHGWVVNLQDDGLFAWGGYGIDTDLDNYSTRVGAADDLDGFNNTKTILELGEDYPAFSAVDFDNGWYLPAAGQLKRLYKNLRDVNSSIRIAGGMIVEPIGVTYWSSTECSKINAWYLSTIGGLDHNPNGYNDSKDGRKLVRSVRNF